MTGRLFSLDPIEGFRPKTFAGHRDGILHAYFSADAKTVGMMLFFSWILLIYVDIHCQP